MPRSWNWLLACFRERSAKSRAGTTDPPKDRQSASAAALRPRRTSQLVQSVEHACTGVCVTYPMSLWLVDSKRRVPGIKDQKCHVRRGEDEGRQEQGVVSAGFCMPITLSRLLLLIIISTPMLPLQQLLIILIADLSLYKNICQNYCLI